MQAATSESFTVRRAETSDAPALLDLRRTLFAETDFMLWEPQEFTASPDDEAGFIAWLSSKPNSLLLVALQGERIIGFLAAAGGDRNRNRHSALVFLGVRRDCWSTGVASALLREAITWAPAADVVRLELTVHTTNARAVALYRRFGFEVEGTRRASLRVGDGFRDEYLMSRVAGA